MHESALGPPEPAHLVGGAKIGTAQGVYNGDSMVSLDLYCVGHGPVFFVLEPELANRMAVALMEAAAIADG